MRAVADFEHHGEPPWRDVAQCLDLGELGAPIAGNISLADRAAPALRLVEMH
jgi:hypothetical protein